MKKVLLSTVAALTLVGAAHAEADKSVLNDATCAFIAGSSSGNKYDMCVSTMENILEAGYAQGHSAVASNTQEIIDTNLEALEDSIYDGAFAAGKSAAAVSLEETLNAAGYSNLSDVIMTANNPQIEVRTETVTVEVPVEVIKEVEVVVTKIVEAEPTHEALQESFNAGIMQGYNTGLEQSGSAAYSAGHGDGYVEGVDASASLVAQAQADLAEVEANIDTLVAEGIAAIDVDAIAHEARKEAINAIAAPIYDHKTRAGDNFKKDPVGFITFAFNYIEDLQSQLGLR